MATQSPRFQRRANIWSARIIPLILIGIVGLATWVVVVLICTNYLLHPPTGLPVRNGAGIAILVLFSIALVFMATTYIRVLQVVITDPGYVPLPPRPGSRDTRSSQSNARRTTREKERSDTSSSHQDPMNSHEPDYLDRGAIQGGRVSPPPGLAQFYKRDIFECEIDGMPRWCSHCKNWKPDRSHHSSEVGRCVYKMDHFCPWAGGMVSETNYKFFIQFCAYAAMFCILTLVVVAYYTAQRHRLGFDFDVAWIAIIALSALFFLFSFGMAYNSILSIFRNSTTVDTLALSSRVHHFAVLMPDWHPVVLWERERRFRPELERASPPPEATTPFSTITFPLQDSQPQEALASEEIRLFAVLASPTGRNPYLLPSRLGNWTSVMGERVMDWFLPIRYSPCAWHGEFTGSREKDAEAGLPPLRMSMYEFGSVIDEMKEAAGLLPRTEKAISHDRYGRRHITEREVPPA